MRYAIFLAIIFVPEGSRDLLSSTSPSWAHPSAGSASLFAGSSEGTLPVPPSLSPAHLQVLNLAIKSEETKQKSEAKVPQFEGQYFGRHFYHPAPPFYAAFSLLLQIHSVRLQI
jgi:hypothetical protein